MRRIQAAKVIGTWMLGVAAGTAAAADFAWLTTPASANWNATDANWSGAGSLWVNDPTNNATFSASGTKGLTLDAVTVKDLTFTADGFTLGGGSLDMFGGVTVGSALSAAITTPIAHTNTTKVFQKLGAGTLVLNPAGGGYSNRVASLKAAAGTLHITGGTNIVTLAGSNPESGPAFWVSGGTLVVGGGLVKTTGGAYARVSDYGHLMVTNGLCDLSGNSELLNAFNSPGFTTVGGSGVLDTDRIRIVKNQSGASLSGININTGGTVRVNEFWFETGDVNRKATVNLNGGTIVAKDKGSTRNMLGVYDPYWTNILVNVLAGGAIFDNNGCNITVIQKLTGSPGDGGLTKLNSGSLALRGTNTYNGATVLKGGTLNIVSDANLGAVPSAPATNLVFATSSTLQSSANHALATNRTIRIPGGSIATFDTQGYTQTVYGVVWGEGTNTTLVKMGAGTLVLDPGPAAVNHIGTFSNVVGTTVCLSGTNLVSMPNTTQNAPGLRICGGTLLVAGGVLKTTAGMYVNVDGGHLLVTNGIADTTSCSELLNGIAGNGFGYTTVAGSGVLVANTVRITQNTGEATNTVVTVSTNGVLRLNNFYIDVGSFSGGQRGMLVLNGGTVEARIDNVNFLGTTEVFVGNNNDKWLTNIIVQVREGGAIFNTAGKSIAVKQPLYSAAAADGGLAKRGDGTLTLLNTNTCNGATSVEGGTLKLGVATNTLLPSATVWVSSNALFDVNGKLQTLAALGGSGTVTNGGFLTVTALVAPGGTNALGTLTLASAPAALGGTFKVDVAANGVCDRLHVRGNLDLSGLALNIADTAQLSKYWSYTVATYTGTQSGAFTSDNLPSRWNVKYDAAAKRVYIAYNPGTMILVH